MKIIKEEPPRRDGVPAVPLRLKPVRMKSSIYLLIPKGVSQLLELDETRECTLTTEKEGRNPVLKYTFSARTRMPPEVVEGSPDRKRSSKPLRAIQGTAA